MDRRELLAGSISVGRKSVIEILVKNIRYISFWIAEFAILAGEKILFGVINRT